MAIVHSNGSSSQTVPIRPKNGTSIVAIAETMTDAIKNLLFLYPFSIGFVFPTCNSKLQIILAA